MTHLLSHTVEGGSSHVNRAMVLGSEFWCVSVYFQSTVFFLLLFFICGGDGFTGGS